MRYHDNLTEIEQPYSDDDIEHASMAAESEESVEAMVHPNDQYADDNNENEYVDSNIYPVYLTQLKGDSNSGDEMVVKSNSACSYVSDSTNTSYVYGYEKPDGTHSNRSRRRSVIEESRMNDYQTNRSLMEDDNVSEGSYSNRDLRIQGRLSEGHRSRYGSPEKPEGSRSMRLSEGHHRGDRSLQGQLIRPRSPNDIRNESYNDEAEDMQGQGHLNSPRSPRLGVLERSWNRQSVEQLQYDDRHWDVSREEDVFNADKLQSRRGMYGIVLYDLFQISM